MAPRLSVAAGFFSTRRGCAERVRTLGGAEGLGLSPVQLALHVCKQARPHLDGCFYYKMIS